MEGFQSTQGAVRQASGLGHSNSQMAENAQSPLPRMPREPPNAAVWGITAGAGPSAPSSQHTAPLVGAQQGC